MAEPGARRGRRRHLRRAALDRAVPRLAPWGRDRRRRQRLERRHRRLRPRALPEVALVEAENRGLGAGWNIGLRETVEHVRPLLNADAWLTAGSLERLSTSRTRGRARRWSARGLVNPDGTLQRSVRGFPTVWRLATEYFFLRKLAPRSSALNAFYAGGFDHDEVREVEVVMGACMLLRREAIAEVGECDEDYFLFSEETGLVLPLPRGRVGGRLLPGRGVRPRARRLAQWAPVPREPPRAPALPLEASGRGRPSARGRFCCALRLRGLVFRGERDAPTATAPPGSPPVTPPLVGR